MKQTKSHYFAPFNEHGSACKGHSNSLTACTFEAQQDRDLLVKCLDNYYPDETHSYPLTTKHKGI
jgi:hypothetical protein